MKVRELNALLKKLGNQNQDAEVQLFIPTDNGQPKQVEPAFEPWPDGTISILPKEIDDAVTAGLSTEAVNKIAQREVYAAKGDQS